MTEAPGTLNSNMAALLTAIDLCAKVINYCSSFLNEKRNSSREPNNKRMHMKRSILLTSMAALGLMFLCPGTVQAATTNGLISSFTFVGLFSPTNSPVVTTNTIGNVITSTYTAKPLTVTTKSILNLIQAEFGTIFPGGSRLAYSLHSSGFVVLDSTGNLVLNVATNAADTNYSFVLSNGVSSATASGKSVTTTTASATNTVTVVTEHVPDYGIYYTDGKGNKFHFNGMLTLKANELQTSTNTL